MEIAVKKINMEDQDLIRLNESLNLTISQRLQLLLKLQQLSYPDYKFDEEYLKRSLNTFAKKTISF